MPQEKANPGEFMTCRQEFEQAETALRTFRLELKKTERELLIQLQTIFSEKKLCIKAVCKSNNLEVSIFDDTKVKIAEGIIAFRTPTEALKIRTKPLVTAIKESIVNLSMIEISQARVDIKSMTLEISAGDYILRFSPSEELKNLLDDKLRADLRFCREVMNLMSDLRGLIAEAHDHEDEPSKESA